MITFHFVKVEVQRPYYKVIVMANGNKIQEFKHIRDAKDAYKDISRHLPCACILEDNTVTLGFPNIDKYI